MLYTLRGGEPWLLMADHANKSSRGWAAYGGGPKSGESSEETAARETSEETRGFFEAAWVLEKLKGQTPVDSGGFHLYFVEIEDLDVAKVNAHVGDARADFRERGPYAWIPFSQVEPYLSTGDEKPLKIESSYLPEKASTNYFWPVWMGSIRLAKANGQLPWVKPEPAAKAEEAADAKPKQ